jgi:pyruvate ferredoxin oxidoreductase alpha subunit
VLEQIAGSRAVAETVARCRPLVVPVYPVPPQDHLVDALAGLVARPGEVIRAESGFGTLSLAIGASAAGARTYTATASQELLSMSEALYDASGLGLPIVMTVANRAIGAPVTIGNDHSDSMSQRDSGWLQLYARDNQHAADLHVLAFRVAEELSLPVLVCMDGFLLTHAIERVDVPEREEVDRYLPAFVPRRVIDPAAPVPIGTMVGPEAFTEVRYLAHVRTLSALHRIPVLAGELGAVLGRQVPGLLDPYRLYGAETVVVALGSVLGTLKDTVDRLREHGMRIGVLGVCTYRPFPFEAVREALGEARRVVVLERAFALGVGGIVTADVRAAVGGTPLWTVVAGLGGRPVTGDGLAGVLHDVVAGRLERLTFLGLDTDRVRREVWAE